MDSLQIAAKAYQKICENKYKYTFDNGESIVVSFRPRNFCHLAGLRKLSDLREFQYENEKPILSAANIYKKALAGDFGDCYLQTSYAYTQEAKERIECLANLSRLLETKSAVYGFNPAIAPVGTSLKSSIILFSDEGYNFYLLLGLAEDQEMYYPETFFLRFDDAYTRGQKIVSIVKTEKL